MRTCMKKAAFLIISAFAIFAMAAEVDAAWPERPITVVIPYASGGGTDLVTRSYAQVMEKHLGVTIVAVNRVGGGGSLAADFVESKPADGYWWLGTSSFNKHMRVMGYSKLAPWEGWQWYKCCNSLLAWAVRPDSPFKTFSDFLDAARKEPEKYKMSSGMVGDLWHEGTEMLLKEAKIKIRQIFYSGGAPSALACLQGEVDITASGVHEQIEFIRGGKLRNLAVFTKDPIRLKDGTVLRPITDFVPGMIKHVGWGGEYTLGVKKDTPVEILEKIKHAFIAATNSPEFEALLEKRFFFKEIVLGEEADKMAAARESLTGYLLWDLQIPGVKVNPTDLSIPRIENFDTWWPPKGYKPRIK